jgi:hypothetical protein
MPQRQNIQTGHEKVRPKNRENEKMLLQKNKDAEHLDVGIMEDFIKNM